MLKNLQAINNLKLEILTGSYTSVDSRWVCEAKGFPFTRLYYIYGGSGVLSCNGKTTTMTPGNLYLLPTNLPISYHCPERLNMLFLHVTLTTPDRFDILSLFPEICQLPCSQEQLARFKDFPEFTDYGQLLEFKNFIDQSVTDCLLAENVRFPVKPYSQEVLQAISYMQNNLTIQLTGEQIARAIFISPSRLYKRFKAETGISLNDYIKEQKVEQAKLLLSKAGASIAEISDRLCFSSPSYFCAVFKQHTGMAPSEYQNQPPTN